MPAYNFKARFAPSVESGDKRQTMRRPRKRPTRPGDKLSLFTGMRTKACRLLTEVMCRSVEPVRIDRLIQERAWPTFYVQVGEKRLSYYESLALAKADGFGQVEEMVKFFEDTYGLPIDLELIKW